MWVRVFSNSITDHWFISSAPAQRDQHSSGSLLQLRGEAEKCDSFRGWGVFSFSELFLLFSGDEEKT